MFRRLFRALGLISPIDTQELIGRIQGLDREILELQKQLAHEKALRLAVEERAERGVYCVERVMARNLGYYDFSKLDAAAQITYRKDAESLLRNEVLLNEIQHLEADWIAFCAKEAANFRAVRDIRMCINALEVLKGRLAQIPVQARHKVDEESLFDPI